MARHLFSEIFQENPDGSLSPLKQINVNGVIFGPGVTFGQGATFGGVNFHLFKNLDIEGDEQNGVLVIKGFYQKVA